VNPTVPGSRDVPRWLESESAEPDCAPHFDSGGSSLWRRSFQTSNTDPVMASPNISSVVADAAFS
jgi:hypothetical protein